jgi:hypothetical protein
MAIEVTRLVWTVPLSSSEKLILLALADHASADGTDIYPGTARLASMTGFTERWITKIRKRLVQAELLVVTKPPTPTTPAHYRIDLTELRRLSDTGELNSPPEPGSPPELSSPPEPDDPEGVNSVPRGGEPSSPKPPEEPPKEPPPAVDGTGAFADLEAEVEAEFQEAARKQKIQNPVAYKDVIRRRKAGERRAEEQQAKRLRQHQAVIDACNLCVQSGIVMWETEDGPLTDRCTHNPSDYEGYEIATAASDSMNAAV